MRNKIALIIILSLILGIAVAYFKGLAFFPSRLAVRSIDKTGIFVGDNKSGIEPVSDEPSRYERTVKALHEGWDYVGIGNSHYQAGRYEEAAEAYKKAYDVDPGNRVFTGLTLIDAYERLSRYDDALSILDELSKTQPISDYGVEKYAAVRARLLAAKNQPAQAE